MLRCGFCDVRHIEGGMFCISANKAKEGLTSMSVSPGDGGVACVSKCKNAIKFICQYEKKYDLISAINVGLPSLI